MPWTPDELEAFFFLVENAWPGEMTAENRAAWGTLLDPYQPADVVAALRRLLAEGRRFRPSVSEVIGAIRRDDTTPTFAEAYQLIFGRGGALSRSPVSVHPLVESFVARQGADRLRRLPIYDPEWGEKVRRDLEREWAQHVEAFAGREVAAIATAGDRRQMSRFDPLRHLTLPAKPELAP
jgi:hypothetical protein